MSYFKTFSSNTNGASGNQSFFLMDPCEVRTARIFYKIAYGGEYNYSVLFSNTCNSTYNDGNYGRPNLECGQWHLIQAKIGILKAESMPEDIMSDETAESVNSKVFGLRDLTFKGAGSKKVASGEFFNSDPILLNIGKDDYLCLQLSFTGYMFPNHEEILLPTYSLKNGKWFYSVKMPVAAMIGCDREVKTKIAFLGDSITQGIGAGFNTYKNYAALFAEKLGGDYSCHNLGLGYARSSDAATDGVWLFQVKQNDIAFICLGVNDILRNHSEEQIKNNLFKIVSLLKEAGVRVVIQTVPPFDYSGGDIVKWNNINSFILTELSKTADLAFDVVPVLAQNESETYKAKYGGHPNQTGCALWAEALYEAIKQSGLLIK